MGTQRYAERLNMKLMRPDAELAVVVGPEMKTWYQVVRTLWDYVEQNNLLTETDPPLVRVDAKLGPLFGGKGDLTFAEMVELLPEHLTVTDISVNKSPATYLLTWNPDRSPWEELQEDIAQLEDLGYLWARWSCGRSKRIRVGDRVFLGRQGVEPKGIMASGTVIVGVHTDEHWEAEKSATTAEANYVEVEWEILLDPAKYPLLSREVLLEQFPEVNWDTQASGMTIKEGAVARLEEKWNEHLKELGFEPIPEEDEEEQNSAKGDT